MNSFNCTGWGFAIGAGGSILAMFQINDDFLIRFDGEDGFYIPEGEEGGNLQAWSDKENAFALQSKFESENTADSVAAASGLERFIEEIKAFAADPDYEFSFEPNSDINGLCKINVQS